MDKLTYISENSHHLLFMKSLTNHLEKHGCETCVHGGSGLGLFKRQNLLPNDPDADVFVTNKTPQEVIDLINKRFRFKKGVGKRHGVVVEFAKATSSSVINYQYDIDVTVPDTYWMYVNEELTNKVIKMFSEQPYTKVKAQGL